jgi:tellurite resistance protein TehA-like permease
MKWLAWVLLVINLIAYAVLSFLLMIRVIGFYPRVKADLTDHTRGPGFLYRHRGNGCPRQPVPDRSGALPNGDGSVVLRAVTVGHFPLSYDPLYWRLVFPLGMYTVCTLQLSNALALDFLLFIPRLFIYVAIAAWLITFMGLIHSLLRRRT